MARVNDIREALVGSLKTVPALASVKTWHMVDGYKPDRYNPTGSVGPGRTRYEQLDNEWDLATTELTLYIATVESQPERGEKVVQDLGEEIRIHLVSDDPTLAGVVRTLDVAELVCVTAADDNNLLNHIAMMQVSMTHLASRIRPATEPPANVVAVETDI